MSSDNEKDLIENIGDIQDDVISWDTIIDTDEDGIVSIKDNPTDSSQSSGMETEVFLNETDESDLNSIKQMIEGVDAEQGDASESDEIDEDELKRILGSSTDINAPDFVNDDTQENIDDGFSEDTVGINVNNQENFSPRKNEVKKNQSSTGLLLIVLLLVILAGGAYYAFNFMSENDSSDDSMVVMPDSANNVDNNIVNNNADEVQNNIPVVNEEQVSEIKPDENQNEAAEKKEVINVIPTGRINPFVPLTKFNYVPAREKTEIITKVKTINNIDYDSINIPKPPKKYGELTEDVKNLMSVGVSGIMYDKVKPSAIIKFQNEDYFVQIGDKLNNLRVVGITPNQVSVAFGKNIYSAKVGEEIKIDLFYGNVSNGNGGRQYYSSKNEFMKSNKIPIKNDNYTSENDVEIIPR